MLLVPCVAMGANTHSNALKAQAAKAIYSNVANAGPISGTVKDETGAALPGVSVAIKGTNVGTQTDLNGHFKLNANPGDVLVFSYVGYLRKEVTVGTNTNYEVSLASDAKSIKEVVVTALGITKSQSAITYDQQTVSGKELETAKDPSFVNSLTGKVAGLDIQTSSSGPGGSTKAVLRGNKSLTNSNNVLYVVDGVPLNANTTGQPNGIFSYGADGGDAISNINPDDIESMSVLKGASASALYGSQAANGVILITTKKGKAGKTEVNFSSNTTFQSPVKLPEFQSEYGMGDGGVSSASGSGISTDSWGAKESGDYYDIKNFYNTGSTLINSVSVSTGSEKNQTYVSYANTHSDGIEPGSTFNKNNFTIRNTSKLFNDKVTIDASANYIYQKAVNRATEGTYFNAVFDAYTFPRGQDLEQYQNFETYSTARNINVQNWPSGLASFDDNPWWDVNRDATTQYLNHLLGSLSAKYDIASWLNFQVRGKLDREDLNSNQKMYATSYATLVGPEGDYSYNQSTSTQIYADALLNFNKQFGDIKVTATAGASLQDNQYDANGFKIQLAKFDNYFNVSNADFTTNNTSFTQTTPTRNQIQSLFISAEISLKDWLYLEGTARNDWSSALAYTNSDDFFYPSVGANAILTKAFKMPDWISFSKIRVSFAGVGNTINSYYSTPTQYPVGASASVTLNPIQPLVTLKPEFTKSEEIGTEWRFLNDHINFDVTLYKTNTLNQLFTVTTTLASGYGGYYLNAGNVQNKGIEGTLGYNGNITHDLAWNSTVTFSMNKNKILSLYTDNSSGTPNVITRFQLPDAADSYSLEARVGQSFGEIYAADFKRDAQGRIIVNTDATTDAPTSLGVNNGNAQQFKDVGNANPNFLLGWNNTFKMKNFDLSFLVDGRFGGTAVDMTQSYLDYYGDSQATATARNNNGGMVAINGVDGTTGKAISQVPAQIYYQSAGSRQGALAAYAYSATNIRLREASLGYTFPGTAFNNKISSLRIAFTGRNLFFFYCKAPYDPDVTMSTDNGLQGIDVFGLPSQRSLGFNISARF